jgi:hypothetical protein
MSTNEWYAPGSIQRKHPANVSKLQPLEFVAQVRGAAIVSSAPRMSAWGLSR